MDVGEKIGTQRHAENWQYYGYIFKVEPTRVPKRLMVGYEDNRGITQTCRGFGPSNWIDELLLVEIRLTAGE